jgi:uncharacterized repeat protein (TIGR03803 family)
MAFLGSVLSIVLSVNAESQQVLHEFGGGTDGRGPSGTLALHGSLYGTTSGAGNGYGTVYKLTLKGKIKTIYKFNGQPDGAYPGGVTSDKKGNLYGTTYSGGDNNWGTIYEISTNGVERILHSFGGNDGCAPRGNLFLDSAGNLYGTNEYGGSAGGCPYDQASGTVFKLSPDGTFTVLHNFTGSPDGADPTSGVVLDKQGNIYGTTSVGGDTLQSGEGVAYKITPSQQYAIIHTFGPPPDATVPGGSLVIDKKGILWGISNGGGAYHQGTVYKIDSKTNIEAVFYSFNAAPDGNAPYAASPALDKAGNIYGSTLFGGDYGFGTIFRVAPDGSETTLLDFDGQAEGAYPEFSGVTLDAKGNIYAVGTFGGDKTGWNGDGTVVKVTP